jgi:hypothetical protein
VRAHNGTCRILVPRVDRAQFGLMLAARMILAHFSISSRKNLPNSVGRHRYLFPVLVSTATMCELPLIRDIVGGLTLYRHSSCASSRQRRRARWRTTVPRCLLVAVGDREERRFAPRAPENLKPDGQYAAGVAHRDGQGREAGKR